MYVYICLSAEVLKTFLGPGCLGSEDEIVSLWHFLVNLNIYGSLFHLAMVQSQCLMAIRMECGLITLRQSCGIYIYIYIYIYMYYQKTWSEEVGGATKTISSIENESSSKYKKHGFTIFNTKSDHKIFFLRNIFDPQCFKPSCDKVQCTY